MPSHHVNKITLSAFNGLLSRYSSAVPEKLRELDTLRYEIIPTTVATRRDSAFLAIDEVEKLVEWKLKHGTFRPKLLQLVSSNDDETVQDTTSAAFRDLTARLPAVKTLSVLKGIGPATASLLLSVAAPASVPFFSDELFRWCMWDESGSPGGWQRKIKYNNKEYEALVGKVDVLVKRLGVRAVDAEKVAWVLGKEGLDVGADDEGKGEEEDKEVKLEKSMQQQGSVEAKPKQEVKKGTKRKVVESKVPNEGTRKSSRTRK
ncbi:hypothetical protein GQ44DRAFT_747095 [Phaeosphaeriaceae sp. PMI808]|nr:hypothetical protein GQ44DRAFT_747095 [Phaeosphaeriaceae sp. PMI808]